MKDPDLPAQDDDDAATGLPAALDAVRRLLQGSDLAEATARLEQLCAQYAEDSTVLALLALARRRAGRPAAARELLEQAVGIEPHNPELWFNLGNLRRGLDDDEGADLAYRRALDCDPGFVPALLNRGNLLRDGGQIAAAVEHYRRALAVRPELAQGWINLVRVLLHVGDAKGAAAALGQARRCLPEDAELIQALAALEPGTNRGASPAGAAGPTGSGESAAQVAGLRREAEQARAAGDLALARQRYRAVLDIAPDDIRSLQFLGLVEHGLGHAAETRRLWQRVLALKPDDVDTLADLGTLLRNQGEVGPAIDLLRRALRHDPNHRAARLSLGFALLTVGAAGEALALGRQLCAELPDNPDAFNLHGYALAEQGDCVGALQALTRAAELAPDNPRILSNLLFASLYHDRLPAAELAALHRRWGARMDRVRPRLPLPAIDPDPQRPLRIGYLSNDLRTHPVGIFMAPILARHDRTRYPALCFSTDPRADDLTRRLRADATQWIDCAGLDDRALAARIRAAGTDILVDLGGHSSGNRLPALSDRPAPIQMIYLGYPYGTGLPAVDYLIGDGTLISPEREDLYRESVLRQPASFLCYRCPVAAPEPASPPCADNGVVTFGSYNALTKLSDRCVDL